MTPARPAAARIAPSTLPRGPGTGERSQKRRAGRPRRCHRRSAGRPLARAAEPGPPAPPHRRGLRHAVNAPLLRPGRGEPDVAGRIERLEPRREGDQHPDSGGVVVGARPVGAAVHMGHHDLQAGRRAVELADDVSRGPLAGHANLSMETVEPGRSELRGDVALRPARHGSPRAARRSCPRGGPPPGTGWGLRAAARPAAASEPALQWRAESPRMCNSRTVRVLWARGEGHCRERRNGPGDCGSARERGGDRGLERRALRPLRRVPRPDRRQPRSCMATPRCACIRRSPATASSTSAAASGTPPSSSPR